MAIVEYLIRGRTSVISWGCVADDFTGATDLASGLVRQGLRVVQLIGVPDASTPELQECDAIVVALKSRSIEPSEAVSQSLDAWEWLRRRGADRCYFKYCSTFDSSDCGNIGPVAAALLHATGCDLTVACPAYPENGRTVYQGHLFVGDRLLSESGMQHHPLTPMTDADLVRVLGRQTDLRVGLVPCQVVLKGEQAVRERIQMLRDGGLSFAILDAITCRDVDVLGAACGDLPLATGGARLAEAIAAARRQAGGPVAPPVTSELPKNLGHTAVLCGSCSSMSLRQVSAMKDRHPALFLDVRRIAAGEDVIAEALRWSEQLLSSGPVLIYSSQNISSLSSVHEQLGRDQSAQLVEQAMGQLAVGLVERGVRRLVVAGGETSGAVVSALGVRALRVGRPIAPGVPWMETLSEPELALALKSGNFGGERFFQEALEQLA